MQTQAPEGNIRDLLEGLFSVNHGKFGSIHALATVPDTFPMNPCIELQLQDGWDALGLPVSSAVIKLLNGSLNEGHDGSISTVDVDASRLQFLNPGWNAVVDQTAKSMFAGLHLAGSVPGSITARLEGLHIYPASSHLQYSTGVKDDRVLATLVFILPTKHEGGAITARLGHDLMTMPTSSPSAYAATTLCWLSGSTVEHEPVTMGAQVMLRYDILHAGQGPAPVLFDPTPVAAEISKVFSAWLQNRDGKNCPQTLYYVISNNDIYGEKLIRYTTFTDLQGPDFAFVNLIRELAQPFGITVTLGQLKQTQFGEAWSPHQVRKDYYGSDDEGDVERYEETAELNDVDELLWHFTPFLSDGKRGKEEDIYDAEFELLCDYEYLKGAAPDEVDWEGWQGEGNTHMTYEFYRLGLRLELPSLEDPDKSSKRKEPPFDPEIQITELERQMRAFDEAATRGVIR
ncbi:unnamed protein product [Peniophora sp. CBMAI 1063]|nr:unnamed protein product [Peniophora sp. CBMAI 1063]